MSYTPTARLVMAVSSFPGQAFSTAGMNCNLYQFNENRYEYAGYSQLEPIAQMFCQEKQGQPLEFLLLCTQDSLEPKAIHTSDYMQSQHPNWEILLEELPEAVRNALDESGNVRMHRFWQKETYDAVGFSAVEYLIHRICYFVTGKPLVIGDVQIGRKQREGLEGNLYDSYECLLGNGQTLKFFLILVDEDKPDDGIRTTLGLLQKRYEHAKKNLQQSVVPDVAGEEEQYMGLNESLWIDTHGSFRDMTIVLSSLLSLLRLDDIEAERIFGVQFQPRSQLHKIVEQKQVMEINRFVAGMEEFATYGSTDILTEYYEQVYGKTVQDETWRVGKWLKAMNMIADGSRFSDPLLYEAGIGELKQVIDGYEEEKQELEQEDPYFSIFVSYIRKEYESLLKGKQPSTVEIIRRCCQKKLYQQALTFLEARMPQYLVMNKENRRNIMAFPPDSKKLKTSSDGEKDDLFLFHKYREMIQIKGAEEHKDSYWSMKEIMNHLDDLEQLEVELKKFKKKTEETAELHAKLKEIMNHLNGLEQLEEELKKIEKKAEETAELYEKLKETKTVFWKSEPEGIQLVKRLLLLHKALCGCRNFFNHASEMDARPDTRQIVKALNLYLRYMDELEEALTRHQEKDAAFYKQDLSREERKEHEKENWSVVLFP